MTYQKNKWSIFNTKKMKNKENDILFHLTIWSNDYEKGNNINDNFCSIFICNKNISFFISQAELFRILKYWKLIFIKDYGFLKDEAPKRYLLKKRTTIL